jgi:hypothetical protein
VRSLLHEAQVKFPSDKAGALIDLKIALHKVQNPSAKQLPLVESPAAPHVSAEMAKAGWGQYLNQLHAFLGQLAARANASMLGVDPLRYAALLRNTPNLNWSFSGRPEIIHTSTYAHVSQATFDEMVNLLIDYAVKASEAYVPMPLKEPVVP